MIPLSELKYSLNKMLIWEISTTIFKGVIIVVLLAENILINYYIINKKYISHINKLLICCINPVFYT